MLLQIAALVAFREEVEMRARIALIGALSLLLGIGFGVQAQAKGRQHRGKTFEQRSAGGIGVTARDSVGDDGFNTFTGVLLAKGAPGSGQIRVEVEALPPVPATDCPRGFELQQSIVLGNFVSTFQDLSMLSGARANGGVPAPADILCLDTDDGSLLVFVGGVITGGNGRFEGATGTWQTIAEAEYAAGDPASPLAYRVNLKTVYNLD